MAGAQAPMSGGYGASTGGYSQPAAPEFAYKMNYVDGSQRERPSAHLRLSPKAGSCSLPHRPCTPQYLAKPYSSLPHLVPLAGGSELQGRQHLGTRLEA